MSRRLTGVLSVAAGLLLLTACNRPDAAADAAGAASQAAATAMGSTLFEVMNQTVIPKSNLIWELAGNLYNDDGNIDAAKLSDQQWLELKDAAAAMGASARTLAGASSIQVAPAGAKIQNEGAEGAFGAAEVQAAIDADLAGFKADAMKLAELADEIAAAAQAHDGTKADDASARLSDVCGACHVKFWYPNQPAQ